MNAHVCQRVGLPVSERVLRGVSGRVLPFWRQYRDRMGPVALTLMDIRGAYSPVDGFFYNRIPKAANSTVMAVLEAFSADHRYRDYPEKDRFFRPSRMTPSHVAALDRGAVFRFTFVRNPYARVLSAYQDKICSGKRQLSRHFPSARHMGPPDFTEFCRALRDGLLYRDAHWAPQASLLVLPPEKFDLIGRVETLETDLAHVVARVWGREYTPIAPVGRITHADQKVATAYSDEAREIIAHLYQQDFALFGYPP